MRTAMRWLGRRCCANTEVGLAGDGAHARSRGWDVRRSRIWWPLRRHAVSSSYFPFIFRSGFGWCDMV